MKKILIPDSKKQMEIVKEKVDGYIIGINDMSVNTPYNVDLNELSNLDYDKEIFISLNKNMENKDIEFLKDILKELNNYPIKGVLYSDVCFVYIKDEMKLNYDLVWSHEHFTTNYQTINYWRQFGVKYTYLSSDITLKDVLKIRNNTDNKLMFNIFGYLPMFVSKRHIVKNYLNKFHLIDQSNINYIGKENKIYPIIDNKIGTIVYSNNILNALSEYYTLQSNSIDYIVFNGFNIDDSILIQVLNIVNNMSVDNVEECVDKIDRLFNNVDRGFLYQDTVSKVKK